MSHDLVITGRIVTPDAILDGGWIAIDGDRIAALGTGGPPDAQRRVDRTGSWILPGGIDAQTHAGSYWGLDGIGRTTEAAAAGGVTTLVDMPFDTPAPLSTRALFDAKLDALRRQAVCDIALYATIAPGQDTGEMEELAKAGVCGFKISVCESHPTRFPRIPADGQLALLTEAARLGLPVGVHNEDQEIVRACTAAHLAETAGPNPLLAHDRCRPQAAELAATATFVVLAETVGAHAHIVHVSNPRGFALLRDARTRGAAATGEICVHYLLFDPAISGERMGAKLKVNPPLRPGVCDALWALVDAGDVTCVSSDHSTMSLANKAGAFAAAGPGMPGLAAMIPAFFTEAERRGLDAPRLIARLFSEGPAQLFGLTPRKGALVLGADADILVLEPGAFTFSADQAHDGVGWSPYAGMTFSVRVSNTFVRGVPVWDGNTIIGHAGHGAFIPRTSRFGHSSPSGS